MPNDYDSFKKTLSMVNSACNSVFYNGTKDIKEKALECATNIYIVQMKEDAKAKHGEWELHGLANPQCSLCGKYNVEKTKFCPNCGADMRGKSHV